MQLARIGLYCGVGAVVALAAATPSRAADVFTDKASFLQHSEVALQTFDSVIPGGLGVTTLSFTAGIYSFDVTTSGTELWGINPGADGWLGTVDQVDFLTITFTGPSLPTALGGDFFVTDQNDAVANSNMSLFLSDGTTLNYNAASSTAFGGFVGSTPITSLQINRASAGTFATINNLLVGVAAPEPATMALMALALPGMAIARRRKK